MDGAPNLISVTGLQKSYGTVMAIGGLDLEVGTGEFVTLLGPSGCGKTTTLRSIAGLETPDAGTISIAGKTVFGPGVLVPANKRHLGMVFQSYAIWPHMTVSQNVGYPLRVDNVPRRESEGRVKNVLGKMGLQGLGDRYPSELSGGKQQRVALARAIVSDPAVILYDEPLSNLDAKLRNQMRFELRALHDLVGTTALYVTHDQQEALVISDRICLMDGGKVIQEGDPKETYEQPVNVFASDFLGMENMFEIASVDSHNRAVTLISGHRLEANGNSAFWDEPEIGDGAMLSVRAHDVQFSDGKPVNSANAINGSIEAATYLGDRVRYKIRIGSNSNLVVDEFQGAEIRDVNNSVTVTIDPAKCIVVTTKSKD